VSQTEDGKRQKAGTGEARPSRAGADVPCAGPFIASRSTSRSAVGTKKQVRRIWQGAKGDMGAAKLKRGYTKIVATFNGVTGRTPGQAGDYAQSRAPT